MATITETRQAYFTQPAFTSIPVLDYSLAERTSTKGKFLIQLREALVIVGFFYLKNAPVSTDVRRRFVKESMQLCDLPLEKKQEIDMVNSKHFLGYSRLGLEKTARKTDHREMFDFLTPMPAPGPEEPIWMNAQGPNQWPDEQVVPGFRPAIESYFSEINKLGRSMVMLVAEALDLEPTALNRFFNDPPRNKVSLLKYPDPRLGPDASVKTNGISGQALSDGGFQGVGAHKDGGFLTFLLQATAHRGLEAQNKSGRWIAVPPIPDTFVVNVGRSLESITGGVCTATTHRVNLKAENFIDSQGRSLGPRYSYPVFQTMRLDLTSQELTSLKLPKHISDLVKDTKVKSDAEAFFARYHLQGPGQGIFKARLTSHPDVGRRWYPELLEQALKEQEEFQG